MKPLPNINSTLVFYIRTYAPGKSGYGFYVDDSKEGVLIDGWRRKPPRLFLSFDAAQSFIDTDDNIQLHKKKGYAYGVASRVVTIVPTRED